MNVAGPSRAPPSGQLAPTGRVGSTYEEDLLGLLGHLSVDEMDELQTFFTRRTHAGNPLSDYDVAMSDLLQQARVLAVANEDRLLARRIAAGEDATVNQRPVQMPGAQVPPPNNNRRMVVPSLPFKIGWGRLRRRTATQQNREQQHGSQAARNGTIKVQTLTGWFPGIGWVLNPRPVTEPTPTNTGAAAPRTPVVDRATGHDCVICQDPIHGAEIRAPCGHFYDIGCITDLFRSAARDESLYPPRCCKQNIPFTQVQPHLSQALITALQQYNTLKRVYCSSRTCSLFLGPLSEDVSASKVYTCPAPGCGKRTCAKCREQYNGTTHVCDPDADAAEVLALGRASGWARCPGCSQMIELHLGCFHMTCRCRTEFCYLCRARWKTCGCPRWDERRLLAAPERVDAQVEEGGARRNVAPARVFNAVRRPITAVAALVPPPTRLRSPTVFFFLLPFAVLYFLLFFSVAVFVVLHGHLPASTRGA